MPRKVRTRKYGKRKHRRSLKRKSKKTRHFRKRHMHKSKKRRQKRGGGTWDDFVPDTEENICNTTRNALKIDEDRWAPSIWDVRYINDETFIKYLKDINLVEEMHYTPEQIANIRDAAYDAYNDRNKSYIQMYACAGGARGLKWIKKDKTSKEYFKDVVENAGFLTKDDAMYEVQKWGKWDEDKWNEKKDDKNRIKVEDIKSFIETLPEFIATTPIVEVNGVPNFSKMDLKRFNMYLFLNNLLEKVGYPETSMMAVRETVTELINKNDMKFDHTSGILTWAHNPSVNLHDVAMAAAKGPGRSGTTQGLYGRMFKNRYNDHCYSTWDNCNSEADNYQFDIESDPDRIKLINQCNLDYDVCKEIRKDPSRNKEWNDYKKNVDVSSSPRDLNTVLNNQ